MGLKEALQTALDFEKKGYDIYSQTAKKSSNPIVRNTFSYLAEQELHHIEEIKEYLEKEKIELKGDKVEDTKKFFTMTVKEFKDMTEVSDDDKKAHEVAMELEQNAFNFYSEQYGKTDNEELKKFFSFLMDQENTHYELVQKAFEYIKDPAAFYSEEEGWLLEG